LDSRQNGLLLFAGNGGDKGKDDSGNVDSDLELHELLDGIIHSTSLKQGLDDRCKVVVHQDNSRGFLGNFSSSNTYRETDIGCLERWSIVGPITSDCNYLTTFLEVFDKLTLIFRAGTSKNTKFRNDSIYIACGELTEGRALYNETTGCKNPIVFRDGFGSEDVITSDHANVHTSVLIVFYSLANIGPKRVLDTDNSEESYVLEDIFK
jgi:hypothetical protein